MEMGNLLFGNSRGNYPVPRQLVENKEWRKLICDYIQMQDLFCTLEDYYSPSDSDKTLKRDNKLIPSTYGGYVCKDDNDEILFEIFPYYWGECTCGADDYNCNLEMNLRNKYYTKEQLKIIDYIDQWCLDNCPECDCIDENLEKTTEELSKICKCGKQHKNLIMHQKQTELNDITQQYKKDMQLFLKDHNEDCLLLKHNFIYHPGKSDEFHIDWYKYPFRDAYMNENKSIEEIELILKNCQQYVLQDISKKNKKG